MKSVLIITDVNFWERISGNRARIFSLIDYLSKKVNLTEVNTGPAPDNIELYLKEKFKADFFVLEKKTYLNSNGYGRRLKKLLKKEHFDVVIIEYIHNSYFLNFLEDGSKLILDTHDIISERTKEFKKYNYHGELYEMSCETEAEIFNAYDYVAAICKPDYKHVAGMIGVEKALLCPHPVTPRLNTLSEKVKNIVFVASAYLPNRDSINWFIANCWPQIIASYKVNLIIYGSVGASIDLNGQRNIVCKGFVSDINQVYSDADIVINPVRFGAGLKIKNIEALAWGLPLITTMHGARGLERAIDDCFLVAEKDDDFVRKIGLLIKDTRLRKSLSDNAIAYVSGNFSPESCFEPLIKIIDA